MEQFLILLYHHSREMPSMKESKASVPGPHIRALKRQTPHFYGLKIWTPIYVLTSMFSEPGLLTSVLEPGLTSMFRIRTSSSRRLNSR
eukprot:scaffold109141_cov18-Tisochrysis_lutea.AAC.1